MVYLYLNASLPFYNWDPFNPLSLTWVQFQSRFSIFLDFSAIFKGQIHDTYSRVHGLSKIGKKTHMFDAKTNGPPVVLTGFAKQIKGCYLSVDRLTMEGYPLEKSLLLKRPGN